jgi:hypothetical protein
MDIYRISFSESRYRLFGEMLLSEPVPSGSTPIGSCSPGISMLGDDGLEVFARDHHGFVPGRIESSDKIDVMPSRLPILPELRRSRHRHGNRRDQIAERCRVVAR